MECGWITARQIEAARVAMTRSIKRGGKVWIRLFPDKPITKKPAGRAPVAGHEAVDARVPPRRRLAAIGRQRTGTPRVIGRIVHAGRPLATRDRSPVGFADDQGVTRAERPPGPRGWRPPAARLSGRRRRTRVEGALARLGGA